MAFQVSKLNGGFEVDTGGVTTVKILVKTSSGTLVKTSSGTQVTAG